MTQYVDDLNIDGTGKVTPARYDATADTWMMDGSNYVKNPSGNWIPAQGTESGDTKVSVVGAKNIEIGTINVGTSAIEIKVGETPLASRKRVLLRVMGDDAVFIGKANTVTISNGFPIMPGETFVFDLESTVRLYAVASSTQKLSIIETN